jgi:arylsulfatase A-like enzyme
LTTVLAFCLGATLTFAQRSGPPNIIFILSDDLNWRDLGCYGQKQIQTPNIYRLAKEDMRFTNAYAGNSGCAPSRSCLLQGLHPGHAHARGNSCIPRMRAMTTKPKAATMPTAASFPPVLPSPLRSPQFV